MAKMERSSRWGRHGGLTLAQAKKSLSAPKVSKERSAKKGRGGNPGANSKNWRGTKPAKGAPSSTKSGE